MNVVNVMVIHLLVKIVQEYQMELVFLMTVVYVMMQLQVNLQILVMMNVVYQMVIIQHVQMDVMFQTAKFFQIMIVRITKEML